MLATPQRGLLRGHGRCQFLSRRSGLHGPRAIVPNWLQILPLFEYPRSKTFAYEYASLGNLGFICRTLHQSCITWYTRATEACPILPAKISHLLSQDDMWHVVAGCGITDTSFWPCLRHGSLACSLPLPSAQASACWGRCPQTPIYYT